MPRVEIKNINSFKFVEKAINHEVERQIDLIESGGKIIQETRLYDANKDETRSMRSKEEANDYRYFPDPDLLPVVVGDDFKAQIYASLPELPDAKKQRFHSEYQLDNEAAGILTSSRALADYFEAVTKQSGCEAKLCANWVNGELAAALNKANLEITESPISPEQLSGLLVRISDNTISGKIAKQVFEALWQNPDSNADAIIDAQGLRQITDTGAIEAVIDEIITANGKQVEQYRGGNDKVFGFFVGQVMKAMQGKANPAEVNKMLMAKLKG